MHISGSRIKADLFDGYMNAKFLLERALGRKVDLVTEEALKPAVRHVRDQAAYASGF